MSFDLDLFWKSEMQAHMDAAQASFESLQGDFDKLLNLCVQALENEGKIIFFGNGGSAADAQHLAAELKIRYISDREPIRALSLATDTSSLTAAGNDLGFEYIFSRQLEAVGRSEDVAVAISTSGNSPNILKALQQAQRMNMKTVGFSGGDGGAMKPLCDVCLIVPSQSTARIQEMHITMGHMLCGALEQTLGLV